MSDVLTLDRLAGAVGGGAVALRVCTRLHASGGDGDKVFPPTYEGGKYAVERRRDGDREVETVLLDSVQSQANRMEEALLAAYDAGRIRFPLLQVDFSEGVPRIGRITSLDAPHRVADAILRDSLADGTRFRESAVGRSFVDASVRNATALFEICPTALLFGMWDSTGPRGGLGAKFARIIVSEIVGFDAVRGVRTSSRIDPLAIGARAAEILAGTDGTWTLDPSAARQEKGKPVRLGKDGKPSEINHGNVTPSIAETGGFTISHARQTTVLSLVALRRLGFPDAKGRRTAERDAAARSVLAALGVAAMAHVRDAGYDLRSRCLLRPEEPARLEVLAPDASTESPSFPLDSRAADRLLQDAVEAAEKAGVKWRSEPIVLRPEPKLVDLVRRSDALAAKAAEASE